MLPFLEGEVFNMPPVHTALGALMIGPFLAAICFYPAIAIAHVFYQQHGDQKWRIPIASYSLLAASFGLLSVFSAMNGHFADWGIVIFFLFGSLAGGLIAVITAIVGCTRKLQKPVIRTLGFMALALMAATAATSILMLSGTYTNLMAQGTVTFGGCTAALALIGVFSAGLIGTRQPA